MSFPKDFVWGAATASYQIEGAALEDGRGECIWTRFSHTPGKVANGDTGDHACNHYHRYAEDVQLMKNIGLDAYRFSIAWSRVIPAGTGATNPLGLDFYDKLVDELLANEITPYITLYHWDLPQALQDRGGWENPDSPQWFADYVDLMTQRLGDRTKHWITHNEPWVVAFLGNYIGEHAPGKTDFSTALKAAHHLLLSHGAAMPVIRQNVSDSVAGITLNVAAMHPASDTAEDKAAAKRQDGYVNRWFFDPLFFGEYPGDMLEEYDDFLGDIDPASISTAKTDNDFIGLNYYTRNIVKHKAGDPPLNIAYSRNDEAEHTEMGWEVYPEGLMELMLRFTEVYKPKALYITENGCAMPDPTPDENTEVVDDPRRVAYYEKHFKVCEDAIAQGVPLKAYFAWSFMDNFEWAFGYEKRFGLHYVDYETFRRVPKQSALYYRDFIKASR